jgi:hypothetical protein
MGAPYNNLLRRVEDAIKLYIEANDAPDSDVSIYRTLDNAAITGQTNAPCYIINATSAKGQLSDVIELQSGLPPSVVSVTITARTIAEDLTDGDTVLETARERHDRLVGRLLDLMTCATLAADLTAQGVSNLAIDQCDVPEELISVSGDHVETEIKLDLVARSTEG